MLYSNFNIQEEIDKHCQFYRELDLHLGSPRSGKDSIMEKYSFEINNRSGIKISKFIRNSTALEKLQAFIDQLDNCFIGIDYFQSNILFERKEGNKLPEKYKDYFFMTVITDSLRSSLDIFAKFLGWYFDLNEKEELGFNYTKLIKPLKQYSPKISNELNKFYKSDEFKFIKELRDMDKHIGKNQNIVNYEQSLDKIKYEFKRSEPISFHNFETQSIKFLSMILKLLSNTIKECKSFELGFNSLNDTEIIENELGYFVQL